MNSQFFHNSKLDIATENILGQFADVVYAKRKVLYAVWLVSPWLSINRNTKRDPLLTIHHALEPHPSRPTALLHLFTRPPKHDWHQDALEILWSHPQCNVWFLPHLHSKLYIMESREGDRHAVLGSPNLTKRADADNKELAVQLKTTVQTNENPISRAINKLQAYASGLRQEEGAEFQPNTAER